MQVRIRPDGVMEFLHADVHKPLIDSAAEVRVERMSDVEPIPDGSGWTADMARVGGPLLGPFPTRAEALAEEVKWLEQHQFPALTPMF